MFVELSGLVYENQNPRCVLCAVLLHDVTAVSKLAAAPLSDSSVAPAPPAKVCDLKLVHTKLA